MDEELYDKETLIVQNMSANERQRLERDLVDQRTGCGTVYKGEHFHLEYRPKRNSQTLKCTGVELVIFNNITNKNLPVSMPRYVPFKPGIIFNKGPYKERLEEMVALMTKDVQDFDANVNRDNERKQREEAEHEAAIKAHAEKVKKCQLKIDATMKAIAPKTKPNDCPSGYPMSQADCGKYRSNQEKSLEYHNVWDVMSNSK